MSARSKTPDREVIGKMLDDVEAVTKGRFYEDPEPIASPIEMFLIRDGRGLHDQDRKKSLTERKDHGKLGNVPSGAARATTDDERKLVLKEAVCRLDAAYV